MKNKVTFITFTLLLLGSLTQLFLLESCDTTKIPGINLPDTAKKSITEGVFSGLVATNILVEDRKKDIEANKQVYLPDISVIIYSDNQNEITRTTTDLDGGYRTKAIAPGKYRICLEKSGYQTTCTTAEIKDPENYPGLLLVPLAERGFVYGKVLLRDGIPGFYRQEYFGFDFHTTVNIDNQKVVYRCNTSGEYLIPAAAKAGARVRAKCQKAEVSGTLAARQTLLNLTLPNSSPTINQIVTFEGNKEVDRTVAGASLNLKANASDVDNQTLLYKWFPWGKHPGFVSPNSNTVNWNLPATSATYTIYLVVNDNFGGISLRKQSIRAIDRKVLFSGTVRDLSNQNPVANATVDVNGSVTTTNANGYFSLSVTESKGRYILNIDKSGYMASSKIYFKDATDLKYPLVPNSSTPFPSDQGVELIETEDKYTRFVRVDDKQDIRITRLPARVKIPPNAIVDENGEQFNGMVMGSIRAVDLMDDNDLMPGDYGGEQNGEDKTLESFGAVDVQLRDQANPKRKLKLNANALATLQIPITSNLLASAKNEIDFWDYDTKKGVWEFIGTLKKQGNYYIGETNKFSTLNADVAFSNASCIEIADNPQASLFPGPNLDLKFQIPTASGVPKLKNISVGQGDLPLFFVRLPPNESITMEVFRAGNHLKTQIIDSGPATPGQANANPSSGDCKVIFLDSPLPSTPSHGFLDRVNNTGAEATAYYDRIGASDFNGVGNPATFPTWKTANGFNAGDDANAVYYNAGDLGFWRGMHVKKTGGNVAFYVSNFDNDVDAVNNNGPFATVCMEYSPVAGTTGANQNFKITKFYVFDGANNLVDNADLDGGGPKSTPGLCLVCHGGANANYAGFANPDAFINHFSANTDAIPNFLHFDVQTFAFSTQTNYLRSDQEGDLRALNENVLSSKRTDAVRNFIKEAYNDNNLATNTLPGVNFIDNSVVTGWDVNGSQGGVTHRNFYTEVVGTTCRGCHITRSSSGLWFDSQANIPNFPVCGNSAYMPNARITYLNFWTDEDRVALFKNYLNINASCSSPQ